MSNTKISDKDGMFQLKPQDPQLLKWLTPEEEACNSIIEDVDLNRVFASNATWFAVLKDKNNFICIGLFKTSNNCWKFEVINRYHGTRIVCSGFRFTLFGYVEAVLVQADGTHNYAWVSRDRDLQNRLEKTLEFIRLKHPNRLIYEKKDAIKLSDKMEFFILNPDKMTGTSSEYPSIENPTKNPYLINFDILLG